MHLLDLFSILVAGLMIGTELTVSLFIHPVMHQLDTPAQTRGLSLFAAVLGRAMPFWYALCLLLFLAETYVHRADAAFPFLLTASLLWAAVIVFTILFLVPINKRIAALSADAPREQWFPAHQRWERLHRLRTFLLLVALVLVVHSLLPR